MSFFLSTIICSIISLSAFGYEGGGAIAGGGGWIEEMRNAEMNNRKVMAREDYLKIVEANGRDIKKELLVLLFEDFMADQNLNDQNLKDIQKILKSNYSLVIDDINGTKIGLGKCPNNENLCTLNSPFSDVILDLDSILSVRYPLTFSEFVGLLAHEYTHHFAADLDHPNYKFARLMAENVRLGKVGEREFTLKEMLTDCESKSGDVFENCFPMAGMNDAENAKNICIGYGFRKAKSYKIAYLYYPDLQRDFSKTAVMCYTASIYFTCIYNFYYARQTGMGQWYKERYRKTIDDDGRDSLSVFKSLTCSK